MHAVHHDRVDGNVGSGERFDEGGRIVDGVIARNSHENKCGVISNKEIVHGNRPASETLFHAIEGCEELDCVIDH